MIPSNNLMEPIHEPDQTTVRFLEFRNGLYQGEVKNEQPNGKGILLDDYMRLYVSEWHNSQMNGRSIIFNSHSKYMYGLWQSGLPNGFIIYRSGDIVILGHFFQGKINGEFIAVFERQSFLAVVEATPEGQYKIKIRLEFSTEEDIKKVSQTMSFSSSVPRDYFSFIKFAKISFIEQRVPLKFTFDGAQYHFGFDDGLGIIFNDDNFIFKMGNLNPKGQLTGIGASYGTVNEQGNFETKSTVQYKSQAIRPQNQIKTLLRHQHRQSINFVNSFIDYQAVDILKQMDDIVKNNLIAQLAQGPSIMSQRRYSEQDFNDSLEYYPKDKEEGLRLRAIRETLYQSITPKIGAEMIPASRDPSLKTSKYPDQAKQLHYTPMREQPEKPFTLKESHKKILESVIPFEYESIEQRKHRIMVQREIGMHSNKLPGEQPNPQMYERNPKTPQELHTTAKKTEQFSPLPEPDIKGSPQKVSVRGTYATIPHQPQLDNLAVDFAKKSLFNKPPQPKHQSEEVDDYEYDTPKKPALYPTEQIHSKERTHTEPAYIRQPIDRNVRKIPGKIRIDPEQQLPRFNGSGSGTESPYHQMTMSQDNSYNHPHPVNTTSSRKLIPIVHEQPPALRPASRSPINYGPSRIGQSPPRQPTSYQQIHKMKQDRSPARDGTIRTVTKSPIKTVSPSKAPPPMSLTDPQLRLPPAYLLTHPARQHQSPQIPASTYFHQSQQRQIATQMVAKKYDYIRQL